MAPIKPTPAVQPMARKSSQYLQNSLRTYELELEDSEKAVAGLDKQISIRQNRMKELQAAEINPANKFSNKARVDNIANAKKLNDLNTLKEQLPEAIETTKQRITDMSKELKETIAYEKKIYAARAANGQQHTSTLPGKRSLPNTQYKDGVAPEAHIRKPNVRAPGYGRQQKMVRSTRTTSTAGRFQLTPNKSNRAALREMNRNKALTSKLQSMTAASSSGDGVKPAMSGAVYHKSYRDIKNKTGGTTSSNSNRPSCYDESRASKRSGPDDDDDDDDDPPHKGDRHALKKRKLAEAQKSSSAAPPASTTSSSGNSSKRPAPEDGEDGPASKRQKSNLAENDSKEDKKSGCDGTKTANRPEKRRRPCGLINRGNACFSNAVIQMLDTAWESLDIDTILGKFSPIEEFSTTHQAPPTSVGVRATRSSRVPNETDIRDPIKEAVRNGETPKVSPAKHLCSVIEQLREVQSDEKLKKAVSAKLFWLVFAYGAKADVKLEKNDPSDRHKMDGIEQQDSFEYFQQILDSLEEDDQLDAEQKQYLKDLFEIQTQTKDVCTSDGCGYESSIPVNDTSNFHGVTVPDEPSNLSDVYRQSKISSTGKNCPRCSSKTIETRSIFTKTGDNLAMLMNRNGTGSSQKPKIRTKIELDTNTIEPISGNLYALSAIIHHEGRTVDQGHYTIYRKFGEEWF